MTFAELRRAIESKKRRTREEERSKARFDYVLADLIGRSIARIYNAQAEMPTMGAAYPALFDEVQEQENIAEIQDNLSAARFRQFAKSFNRNYKEVANVND